MSSYSSDMLKKATFTDELNNVLNESIVPLDQQDESFLVVREYLLKRVKEIEKIYK